MDLEQNEHKSSPDAKGPEKVARLYLLPQGPTEPRRSPSWIARWMGLAPYRGGLLSERARIELNFAAGLLLLICLFEVVLWTFLFNAIYNRDVFYLGPRVVFAVLSAGFFGFAVFWFERQILTFDDRSKARTSKLRWAMVVRLLYILGAAYVTSKPFELMLFREPIAERAHQETLRQNVATRLLEVQESYATARTANQSSGSAEGSSRVGALVEIAGEEAQRHNQILDAATSAEAQAMRLDSQLREARSDRDRLSSDVAYLGRVLAAARSRLNEATGSGSADQLQELRMDEEQARSAHAAALRAEAAQGAEVQSLTEQLSAAQNRVQDLAAQGDEATNRQIDYSTKAAEERLRLAKLADSQRLRLRRWVASVKALRPGQEKSDGDWVFSPQKPDFLDQLRILNDLRAGRPPMWTQGTEETRQILQDEYGFADTRCTDGGLPSGNRDPQAGPAETKSAGLASDCRQLEAQKTVYTQLHTVSWLVALLIPSLMIAIKTFMLPEELRFYYSRRHQAEEGDPDALRATEVDDEVQASLREMDDRE